MSEYYCHAVHGDDCAALIQASRAISENTKRVAREYGMLMRMGSVLRAGGTLVSPALTAIRDGGDGVDPRIADRRLAIALSQLSHRAADGYFKPVYRELAPEYYDDDYTATPSDIRIMHDIAVFHARKNMKLANGDPKYDPLVFRHIVPLSDDQTPGDARFLETVFGARVIQELLGLHDLFPENADTDRKLKAYIMALDPTYIDTVRYADMAAQPHINYVQRYIIEPNFYDPDDPFISLAVDIQNGMAPDDARLAAAKAADPESLSQWGATLALGVRYYEAAQAYMDGAIDLGAFEEIALS
jgi:hypothetical protein